MTSTHDFPRFGEPVKRRACKDELLLGAVDVARESLVATGVTVGEHLRAVMDDERLATHYFRAHRDGYRGWEWYVSLARAPRSRDITVCDSGLVAGENSIVAPEWVPWVERASKEELEELQDEG